jgi:Flp pilus assembly protein TadD
LKLEPGNQHFVNDLGWCLFESGHFAEAEETLARAAEMDPEDELARENLRFCRARMARKSATNARRSQSTALTKRKRRGRG